MTTPATKPENIARLRGYVKIQPEYIAAFKARIRSWRDRAIKQTPDLASVYRSDAKELLSLATALKKGGKREVLAYQSEHMDTATREYIPDEVWKLLHPNW